MHAVEKACPPQPLIQKGQVLPMKKIVLLLSITFFGWVGWWLGARFGIMTAYWISFAGSLAGVYVGCRINRDYLG